MFNKKTSGTSLRKQCFVLFTLLLIVMLSGCRKLEPLNGTYMGNGINDYTGETYQEVLVFSENGDVWDFVDAYVSNGKPQAKKIRIGKWTIVDSKYEIKTDNHPGTITYTATPSKDGLDVTIPYLSGDKTIAFKKTE